jgi:predicted PurR-regulated permease PerM
VPTRPEDERPQTEVVDLDLRTVAVATGAVLALLATFTVLASASTAATLIVVAVLLALALDPVVEHIGTRFHIDRGWAVGLLCVIGSTIVVGIGVLFGPSTVDQARSFQEDLPAVVAQLGDIPLLGPILVEYDVTGQIEAWLSDLPSRLAGLGGEIADAAEAVTSAVVIGFGMVVVLVGILIDGPRLASGAMWVTPPPSRERVARLGQIIHRVVGQYFAGSIVLATLQGLQVLITGLVLSVPLSPLLAVWAAVWNLVPQIGGAVGGLTFVLVAFSQGPTTGVIAAAVFMGYLMLANNVLLPIIIGNAVNISPLTTMVAAIGGFSVGGVAGAMLAVPIVGAGKAMYFELRPSARPGSGAGDGSASGEVGERSGTGGDAGGGRSTPGSGFRRAFRRGALR